jgi:two-component sensor histidine kinase
LYHTGVITILIFSWVLFKPKKERLELILFFFLSVITYLIGELNLLEAPDFSEYPETQSARIFSLIGYSAVALIFMSFIRSLNIQYERKLSETLVSKEAFINEVLIKTKALEEKSDHLEGEVTKRTSELLEQQEILVSKNAEKEILLKEIHHRVKNNLQIIVSLLNLQSRKFEDQKVLDAINETQNRIISMSLVHQRMYQTSNFVAVDFKDYTDLLIENIRLLFADNERDISHLNSISKDFKIDIERAIPLGLIINEMVTNSFKHAFKNDIEKNIISINIKQDDQSFTLSYEDNGCGFPNDFNVDTAETLGIQLIAALVEQINGKLGFYNKGGAVYEIVLPL